MQRRGGAPHSDEEGLDKTNQQKKTIFGKEQNVFQPGGGGGSAVQGPFPATEAPRRTLTHECTHTHY